MQQDLQLNDRFCKGNALRSIYHDDLPQAIRRKSYAETGKFLVLPDLSVRQQRSLRENP
jgi:hypothetical protein